MQSEGKEGAEQALGKKRCWVWGQARGFQVLHLAFVAQGFTELG